MAGRFEGMAFANTSVQLDDCAFKNCTFHDCRMVYSGGRPPTLDGCQFHNSEFEFKGPAANTVAFMQAMTDPHSGLQAVIRGTFPALHEETSRGIQRTPN